jgi:hypothetical protein
VDIKVIPPGSFVIIKVPDLEAFVKTGEYEELSEYFENNNCHGIFISGDLDLQVLGDNELAKLGLKRKERH